MTSMKELIELGKEFGHEGENLQKFVQDEQAKEREHRLRDREFEREKELKVLELVERQSNRGRERRAGSSESIGVSSIRTSAGGGVGQTWIRDFQNYHRLTEEETDSLTALCLLISPDELIGKVIFPNNAMCGDGLNEHYELSAVRSNLLVSDSVVIGGNVRSVTKIMTYKEPWIVKNWIGPMEHFRPRLQHMLSESGNNGCCCTIL